MTFRILSIFFILLAFPLWKAHSQVVTSQTEGYSYSDKLRGGQRKERWCYDVGYYDLHLKIDTAQQAISGKNIIRFTATEDFTRMQIDLFANMNILSITTSGRELKYNREYDAVFIQMDETVKKGTIQEITVEFRGKPQIAKNPPWDGGFIWTKDNNNTPWIAVSCQGTGASLWWPVKEDLSDEPDSMRIHCNVPNGLRCVANGTEEPAEKMDDGTTTFHWKISYPINNYNVSVNIGDYAHWHDTYTAEDGDILDLDYYVLSYNKTKAEKQFQQVKPMLSCYEKYLGKYPFWKDGYALVETPYLGMEHQSAIAYGNKYKRGYAGMDRSGMNLDFDYIIIHETGHEWWGNSVSAGDLADMWIHESFCTYSEAIYVECMYGYDTAMKYVNALTGIVGNKRPMIGIYGLNKEGDADMYVKGMLFLNTLRHVVSDDNKWWGMIKNMSDTTFKMRTTNYGEVVTFFNQKTGMNLSPVFEQYVKHPSLPVFEYRLTGKKGVYFLKYRWQVQAKNFAMPIDIQAEDKTLRIHPTAKWQTVKLPVRSPADFSINNNLFYIKVKNVDIAEKMSR